MFLNAQTVYNIVPFNHLSLSVNLRETWVEGKDICIREMTLPEAPPPPITAIIFTKYVPLNTIARKNHINIFVQKQHPRFSFILLLNENMK